MRAEVVHAQDLSESQLQDREDMFQTSLNSLNMSKRSKLNCMSQSCSDSCLDSCEQVKSLSLKFSVDYLF